jgi:hypothetical protein
MVAELSTLEAVIIAGANGAGKATFARQLLPALHPDVAFLNVDEIQDENRAFAHPVAAGRELLRRLEERERLRASFALETTLSSTTYTRRVRGGRRGTACTCTSSRCPPRSLPCSAWPGVSPPVDTLWRRPT